MTGRASTSIILSVPLTTSLLSHPQLNSGSNALLSDSHTIFAPTQVSDCRQKLLYLSFITQKCEDQHLLSCLFVGMKYVNTYKTVPIQRTQIILLKPIIIHTVCFYFKTSISPKRHIHDFVFGYIKCKLGCFYFYSFWIWRGNYSIPKYQIILNNYFGLVYH